MEDEQVGQGRAQGRGVVRSGGGFGGGGWRRRRKERRKHRHGPEEVFPGASQSEWISEARRLWLSARLSSSMPFFSSSRQLSLLFCVATLPPPRRECARALPACCGRWGSRG